MLSQSNFSKKIINKGRSFCCIIIITYKKIYLTFYLQIFNVGNQDDIKFFFIFSILNSFSLVVFYGNSILLRTILIITSILLLEKSLLYLILHFKRYGSIQMEMVVQGRVILEGEDDQLQSLHTHLWLKQLILLCEFCQLCFVLLVLNTYVCI